MLSSSLASEISSNAQVKNVVKEEVWSTPLGAADVDNRPAPCEAEMEDEEETDSHTPVDGQEMVTVQIPLSAAIETSLCRRGRRRFHEIQQCHPAAKVRFDRRKKILKVVGTQEMVDSVRRQLESLGGSHKLVPDAVWYELLRTRSEEDASKSLLLQVQEKTGCRIHIERGQHEVRIFGPDEEAEVAERMIDELSEICLDRQVLVQDGVSVHPSALQCIAETCEVTITLQKGSIMVYGIQPNLDNAVEEVETELIGSDGVETDDDFDVAVSIASCPTDSWRSQESEMGSLSRRASDVGSEVHAPSAAVPVPVNSIEVIPPSSCCSQEQLIQSQQQQQPASLSRSSSCSNMQRQCSPPCPSAAAVVPAWSVGSTFLPVPVMVPAAVISPPASPVQPCAQALLVPVIPAFMRSRSPSPAPSVQCSAR
mmetsp:Transcript_55682/g.132767  ORF Transcript_55682/g.132767 Transcript_55682/m.132767 type:complete len:425 (-) Transcript_55682:111-1385(-)|eukprot:CAMPEP_0178432818 /NCGR_PEP_ID=MMETSP0689_2-20121128/32588_1 /TAXON_ID=160604 /ORGANISM="Amphidinium massartii, Strain CS-259" /LENGTH=424 /DNA_ID=CAMNT_0020054831 /DNA_START=17 /DNA_END=1291 /DNA_ORIENTATION=+